MFWDYVTNNQCSLSCSNSCNNRFKSNIYYFSQILQNAVYLTQHYSQFTAFVCRLTNDVLNHLVPQSNTCISNIWRKLCPSRMNEISFYVITCLLSCILRAATTDSINQSPNVKWRYNMHCFTGICVLCHKERKLHRAVRWKCVCFDGRVDQLVPEGNCSRAT
jgi:hypothetical protein